MTAAGAHERGWQKYALIRALAMGEKNQTELATEYGVKQPAISKFASKYAVEINRAKRHIEDAFGHLPMADKANRLAAYEQILSECEDVEVGEWSERRRIAMAGIRAIADELGQIPNKSQVSVDATVEYNITIEGLDVEALK